MQSSKGSVDRRLDSLPRERAPAEFQTTAWRQPRTQGVQLRVEASQPGNVDGRLVSLGEHEDPLNLDFSNPHLLMQRSRQEFGHLRRTCDSGLLGRVADSLA